MDAAKTLREARERAGLTQAALAAATGTSQATISAYEGATKQPSVATLSRLLAATGSRLTVQAGAARVRRPSAAQHGRTARVLDDVLALAAELPTRHQRTLRFPRLAARTTPPR